MAPDSRDKSEAQEPGRLVYLRNNAGGSQSSQSSQNSSGASARSSSETPSSEASNNSASESAWWLAAVPQEGSLGVMGSRVSSGNNSSSSSLSSSSTSSAAEVGVGGPADARVADACRWRCEAIHFSPMRLQTSYAPLNARPKAALPGTSLASGPNGRGNADSGGNSSGSNGNDGDGLVRGEPVDGTISLSGGGIVGTQALSEDGRLTALTPAELEHFVKHGYVVCRAAAARAPCEEALAYVNSRLGRTGSSDSGA